MFGKMFNRNKRQITKEKDTFGKMLETLYFQHKGCNMTPTFFFKRKQGAMEYWLIFTHENVIIEDMVRKTRTYNCEENK